MTNEKEPHETLTEIEINLLMGLVEVEEESLLTRDLPHEHYDTIWHKLNLMRCEMAMERKGIKH